MTEIDGGASVVWAVADAVNLLCEVLVEREEVNTGTGIDSSLLVTLDPGVRVGWNVPGGIQLVGGIGLPIGLTGDTPDLGVLLYLSVEHAFTAAARAERSW